MNLTYLSCIRFALLTVVTYSIFVEGVYAQTLPIDEASGRITFKEVVEAKDVTAKALYHSGLKFYRTNFLIEDLTINDPDNYSITGPMSTSFRYLGKDMIVFFNADLQFREGRYRYNFENLKVDTSGGGIVDLDKGFPFGMAGKKKITENVQSSMDEFVSRMKDFIIKDSSEDDW